MEKRIVLRIVEENVDGCGSGAEMFVESAVALDDEQRVLFEKTLAQAKADNAGEDFSTEDFVNAAIELFNEQVAPQYQLSTVREPYYGTVSF